MSGNSESVRKSEKKKKEVYGKDFHKRIGAVGGSKPKRGYFGRLKDEGKTDELRTIAHQGAEKSNSVQRSKRESTNRDSTDGELSGD